MSETETNAADLPAESPVMTVDEVAELLKVSRPTIYTAVRDARLPGAIKIGKVVRISRVALMDWLRGGGVLHSDESWREPARDSETLVSNMADRARLALSALEYGRVDLARKHISDLLLMSQRRRVSRKRPRGSPRR